MLLSDLIYIPWAAPALIPSISIRRFSVAGGLPPLEAVPCVNPSISTPDGSVSIGS